MSANLKYLESITAQLKPIPVAAAARVGYHLFLELVAVSTNEGAGFDSGQAAANWKLEPYAGAPNYSDPQILWGYGNVTPVGAVGYKTYYQDSSGVWVHSAGNGGDRDRVYAQMYEYANLQAVQYPDSTTGYVVYNPVSSSFPGFAPGDSSGYEENALSRARAAVDSAVAKAVHMGEQDIRSAYKAVK